MKTVDMSKQELCTVQLFRKISAGAHSPLCIVPFMNSCSRVIVCLFAQLGVHFSSITYFSGPPKGKQNTFIYLLIFMFLCVSVCGCRFMWVQVWGQMTAVDALCQELLTWFFETQSHSESETCPFLETGQLVSNRNLFHLRVTRVCYRVPV